MLGGTGLKVRDIPCFSHDFQLKVELTIYLVTFGDVTFSGKHTVLYIDIELECIPETYIMYLTNITSVKNKVEEK